MEISVTSCSTSELNRYPAFRSSIAPFRSPTFGLIFGCGHQSLNNHLVACVFRKKQLQSDVIVAIHPVTGFFSAINNRFRSGSTALAFWWFLSSAVSGLPAGAFFKSSFSICLSLALISLLSLASSGAALSSGLTGGFGLSSSAVNGMPFFFARSHCGSSRERQKESQPSDS